MSPTGENFPVNVDEEARRRFERALTSGIPVPLEECLPAASASSFLSTLEELVSIVLEFSWKQWAANKMNPRPQALEHYLTRFPLLTEAAIRARLIEVEQRARCAAEDSDADSFSITLSESHEAQVAPSVSANLSNGLPTDLVARSEHFSLIDQISTLLPDYEIIESIDGCHEPAWRARGRTRKVAAKLSHFPPIRREVVTELKQIRAPYIVSMKESLLLPDGSAVLVMEEIPGRSLKDRIVESGSTIPEETALKWMKQVCESMTYVAARKIVHRNLKPANIVIDEQGIAYVDDFHHATITGTTDGPRGTPQYMPPENWATTTTADVRGDIYSIGATFFHALAGKSLVSATGGKTAVRPPPAVDLQSIMPHLSDSTVRLLERCMATQPSNRFQSFIELLTQLDYPTRPIRLDEPPPDLPNYHLLSCLGAGGMGVVYKARRTHSDRHVALKFISCLGRNNLDFLARFRIEAEAVACLRHPNIVAVLDIGAFAGYPYLALEYAEGGSLHDRLGEFLTAPIRSAEVAAGVALGLHHAHRLGILHRDLKPQNILLSEEGIPKITDFGLAKFMLSAEGRAQLRKASIRPAIQGSLMTLDRFMNDGISEQQIAESTRSAVTEHESEFTKTVTMETVRKFVTDAVREGPFQNVQFLNQSPTRTGDVIGTPAYMAPEQSMEYQAALGPQTDIYALGIVLYQLLSGRLPFIGKSFNELIEQIRCCPPPPLGRHVPQGLVTICMRCLSKRPEDRYHTAAELGEQLQHFISSQESTQSTRTKWWKLWRK